MVERSERLNLVFMSLAHPVRRDILRRGIREEMSVSDLAKPYNMSVAAISKHIQILEKAKLIQKRRAGKRQFVRLSPAAFKEAATYLQHYEKLWNSRLDRLEQYLSSFPKES